MKPRLISFLLISAWLLTPLPAAGHEDSLASICSDYRSSTPLAAPADDEIPDLRHGRGLLWQIEAPNGNISHLFGSLHSQDRRVTGGLPPQVRLALVRSRQLLIEVVPDADSQRVFFESMFAGPGVSVSAVLADPLYQAYRQIVTDYHIPADQAGQLAPWAAFSLIGRPRPVNAPTQEMVLYQEARERGIPVAGLESMQELVDALASLSIDDQIEILTDTLCNHDRIVAGNRILLDLYMARNLAGMVAYNEGDRHDDEVFERFMGKVLYERNERMLARMRPYLDEGSAFVVVGALHLPAEGGLLELLEADGYSVRVVY